MHKYNIMLLGIPYQAIEVGNIHLSPFQTDKYGKSLAKLSYKDTSIEFQDVSIISPPLKVIDYNVDSCRLKIDLSEQFMFQTKLNTLQEYLVSTFYLHQQSFLNNRTALSYDDVRSLFHFLLFESTLSLYIFPNCIVKRGDGSIMKVIDISPGDTIRCVIRIHGITQIINRNFYRLRLQHSIPAIWFIGSQNEGNVQREIAATDNDMNANPSAIVDMTIVK
jgi:hypothetical protein